MFGIILLYYDVGKHYAKGCLDPIRNLNEDSGFRFKIIPDPDFTLPKGRTRNSAFSYLSQTLNIETLRQPM